ncbi:MAG TPA: 2-oxo acid dehydrogenase subunit E2 [Dactylosporangium sp.]|nr:2-oxo acid dehydrogenase subunit E2 [Dactylosporangium sp.]
MNDIVIPRLNTNDATYILVEWLVAERAEVRAGDPVVVVETSKATEELEASVDGFVYHLVGPGTECGVGAVVGQIRPQAAAVPVPAPVAVASGAAATDLVITEPARALMAEHGISEERVRALGRRVVRTDAVAELVGSATGTVALGKAQRAVADVVTASHRSVPDAFVAMKVRVDGALALGRELTRRERCLVGLPELLVKAVASLEPRFRHCYAALVGEDRLRLADAAHVGITIDVGTGLRVPVVRDAAARPWRDLATAVMRYRLGAMKGEADARDLRGANIVVALHTDDAVTFAVPIVFPGQVCAVSLGAIQRELDLADDGTVTARTVVQLGLAFDHRVINGREAVQFLTAIRELLESPPGLEQLG